MLGLTQDAAIWLCTQPTDMRKSYNGLIALVKHQLGADPQSGAWFIFINKRQTMLKALYFSSGGYCLWCKRLEVGQFNYVTRGHIKQALIMTEFMALLDGVELKKTRQYKRLAAPKKPTN